MSGTCSRMGAHALSSGVQPVEENLTSDSTSGSASAAPVALLMRMSRIVCQSDPALHARPFGQELLGEVSCIHVTQSLTLALELSPTAASFIGCSQQHAYA